MLRPPPKREKELVPSPHTAPETPPQRAWYLKDYGLNEFPQQEQCSEGLKNQLEGIIWAGERKGRVRKEKGEREGKGERKRLRWEGGRDREAKCFVLLLNTMDLEIF